MTVAQKVVSLLLEDFQRDYVFVFGDGMPEEGVYMLDLEHFMRSMCGWSPEYRGLSVEQVVDDLLEKGNAVVFASKGVVRLFSRSPKVQLSRAALDRLENKLGLGTFKTIGYSAKYSAQPTQVSVESAFGLKQEQDQEDLVRRLSAGHKRLPGGGWGKHV